MSWALSPRSGLAWRPRSHAAQRSLQGRASQRARAPAHAAREDGGPLADRRTRLADRQQLARPDHVRTCGGERHDRVPRREAAGHRVLAGEALPPGTCKHCGRINS